MNHDHLRVLVEVAQLGSFSRVAKQRDLDPSAVSRIVQTVERDLGLRLFHRSTRQVALTEAGAQYLSRIARLLEEFDAAAEELKSMEEELKGTLKVTASVAFGQACLVPLVPEFMRAHPDINVELLLTDDNVDLIAERIDLALRISPRMAQDMVRVKWFDATYKLCATPEYLLRSAPLNTIDDLSAHRFVLFGYPQPQSLWHIQAAQGEDHKTPVRGAIIASNGLAQLELTLASVGAALMPAWLAGPALQSGSLVERLAEHSLIPSDFEGTAWMLYPNRIFLPAKTRALINFLAERKPSTS